MKRSMHSATLHGSTAAQLERRSQLPHSCNVFLFLSCSSYLFLFIYNYSNLYLAYASSRVFGSALFTGQGNETTRDSDCDPLLCLTMISLRYFANVLSLTEKRVSWYVYSVWCERSVHNGRTERARPTSAVVLRSSCFPFARDGDSTEHLNHLLETRESGSGPVFTKPESISVGEGSYRLRNALRSIAVPS